MLPCLLVIFYLIFYFNSFIHHTWPYWLQVIFSGFVTVSSVPCWIDDRKQVCSAPTFGLLNETGSAPDLYIQRTFKPITVLSYCLGWKEVFEQKTFVNGRHSEIIRSAHRPAAVNESPLTRKHHELHFNSVIKPLGAVTTLFNLSQVAFAHWRGKTEQKNTALWHQFHPLICLRRIL